MRRVRNIPDRADEAEATARGAAADALLEVRGLSVHFGGIVALDAVSFAVPRASVCGLIGPNGAGKTTLFNCISRLYPYQEGELLFEGRPLASAPVEQIAGLGIGRTFQNLAMFRSMSVRDNILVGAHTRAQSGFLASMLRLRRARAEEARLREEADTLITALQLGGVAEQPAGELPFGIQKRVEFARALAARPRLLLLDEPAAGLHHAELPMLGDLIRQVCEQMGITVLLVEHHMGLVMRVSDWIIALNFGRKIAEGTPATIQRHPEVVRAYLGQDASQALATA